MQTHMQTRAPRGVRALIAAAGAAATLAALLAPWNAAQAQLGNLLNQGGSTSSGLSNLGGLTNALSGSSVVSSSLGNVTGLLQYCIQNDFLSADSASSVKDSLLSQLPGGASTTDSGYTKGTNGILTAGNGSQLDLSANGLKEAAAKQVCDKILTQAKSML